MPAGQRRQTSASAQPTETLSEPAEAVETPADDFDWDTLVAETRAQEYTRNTVPAVDSAAVRATVPDAIKSLIHGSYGAFNEAVKAGEVKHGVGHRRVQIEAAQAATRVTKVPNRERGEAFLKHARTYAKVAQVDGVDTEMTVRGDVDKDGTAVVWRAKPKETRARR